MPNLARYVLATTVAVSAAAFGVTRANVPATEASPLHFRIDVDRDVRPISRYIYGINLFREIGRGLVGNYLGATLVRVGGNRLTAYNWTNNASNAGADFRFQNDNYLVSWPGYAALATAPGGALVPTLDAGAARGVATLLTVPTAGYVSADAAGDGDVRRSGSDYLHTRFRESRPTKGAPFTLAPDPGSPVVYQDEFVNWAVSRRPSAGPADSGRDAPPPPIWFDLDNEPDLWAATHAEIHPAKATYAELVERSIAYATAIKDVAPHALVFGPGNYGWQGYVSLQGAPDADGRDFQEFYLAQIAAAEKRAGRRLLDVFDVHWYPEATGGGVRVCDDKRDSPAARAARLQAPRSLWDPTYAEVSWIVRGALRGRPINLLARLQGKIDRNDPGVRLSFGEYDYGGGANVTGGIAEADVLGIFGREGVFAACQWPEGENRFVGAGLAMYRDFDGHGGRFGDTSVRATTDDVVGSSVYAAADSADADRLTVVALNKTPTPRATAIEINGWGAVAAASAFQLTDAAAAPAPAPHAPTIDGPGRITYTLPAYSVTTIAVSRQK